MEFHNFAAFCHFWLQEVEEKVFVELWNVELLIPGGIEFMIDDESGDFDKFPALFFIVELRDEQSGESGLADSRSACDKNIWRSGGVHN